VYFAEVQELRVTLNDLINTLINAEGKPLVSVADHPAREWLITEAAW
jgi:hypothetical protein